MQSSFVLRVIKVRRSLNVEPGLPLVFEPEGAEGMVEPETEDFDDEVDYGIMQVFFNRSLHLLPPLFV